MVPASAISQAIRVAVSFPGGQTWAILCDAIGDAVSTWAVVPGNIVVQGVSSGVVGAGTVTGMLTFTGPTALVVSQMTAGGLVGMTTPQVGTAIGLGLLSSLNGLVPYLGVSTGVGSGTDVSVVTSVNAVTLAVTLRSIHVAITAGLGGFGSSLPAFYTAIAAGIAAMVQTGVTLGSGIVTPTGPLGPGSSVGTTISIIR